MTDDLITWLKATIEGDKAAAEANDAEVWTAHNEGEYDNWTIVIGDGEAKTADSCGGCCSKGTLDEAEAKHIALHDPRDTIARCEAELAMLDKLPPVLSRLGWIAEEEGQGAPHPDRPGEYMAEDEVADYFVKLLASGYRHRPGFRPEWVED